MLSSLSFAQNRVYASSQVSNVDATLCLGCGVYNPQNAVGANEDDYSNFFTGVGVAFWNIEQTLIFPGVTTDKLVVGIGKYQYYSLSTASATRFAIETMNGNIPNNDRRIDLAGGSGSPTEVLKRTIELQPTKPYDRVKITLLGTPNTINLIAKQLRVYYAYHESPVPSFTAYSDANGQIILGGDVSVKEANISIINMLGKEVYRSKIYSKTIELSSPLPTGVYILNLQTKDQSIYSQRIIIK
ncbi:fibronectin type III domain protein [Chryseobacterium sp. StRB126]|nr:fibronectin type III domain protein [Chryseobacterium sp. StRB126]